MNKNLERLHFLLDRMDRQIGVRAAVCILPGVFAVQLARKLEATHGAGIVAALVLLVGAFTYVQWPRLRGLRMAQDEDASLPAEAAVSQDVGADANGMNELVAMYGDHVLATQAATVEAQANPEMTWNQAIAQAVRRKHVVDSMARPQSEN